jgi:hypothetical protein
MKLAVAAGSIAVDPHPARTATDPAAAASRLRTAGYTSERLIGHLTAPVPSALLTRAAANPSHPRSMWCA